MDLPMPDDPWVQRAAAVRALQAEGRDDEARARVHAAAESLPVDPAADAVVDAIDPHELMRLGASALAVECPAPALRLYRAALLRLQRREAVPEMQWSNVHHGIGHALLDGGDAAAAIPHLERSLQHGAAAAESPISAAATRNLLAFALGSSGDPARALPLYEQVLVQYEAAYGPHDARVARTLSNLGSMADRLGQGERAQACYLQSVNVHLQVAEPDDRDLAITAANAFRLALRLGNDEAADALCDLLVQVAQRAMPAPGAHVAEHLRHAVDAAWQAHDPVRTERLAQQGLALVQRVGLSPAMRQAFQRRLANAYRAKGHPKAAEEQLLELLASPGRSEAEQIEDWTELGRLVLEAGPRAEASALHAFSQALALLHRQSPPSPRALASVSGNLGRLHFHADRLAEAEGCWRDGLACLKADRDAPDRPWLEHGLALVLRRARRDAEALVLLKRAQRRWRRQGARHPFVTTAQADLALAQWHAGDLAGAARSFAAVESARSSDFARRLTTGSDADRLAAARDGLEDLYRALSLHFAGQVGGRLAAEMLIRRKGAVQRAMVVSRACGASASAGEMQRLVELGRQISRRVVAHQCWKQPLDEAVLAALQHEADTLMRSIGHRAGLAEQVGAVPTVAAVRAALPRGAVLVDYLRWLPFDPWETAPGPARYAALVLPRRGGLQWFDLGPAEPIDGATQRLAATLADLALPDPAADLAALDELVLQPLRAAIGNARHVVVAPDGALNLVPFVLLGTPPLGETAVLSQVAGGAELLPPAGVAAAVDGEVVALVAPDHRLGVAAALPARFRDLPGARAEGEALCTVWPGTRRLQGTEATVEALLGLRRPALLHLAMHAYFRPPAQARPLREPRWISTAQGLLGIDSPQPSVLDDPLRHAGLVLAGADGGAEADSIVTAAEVALLDLAGTELVALSACNTGLGRHLQGEEFSGLRRALVLAGSRSQLTSLWPVDDAASAWLMRCFYRALSAGAGRAEALQQARQEVRRQPGWSHPSFWAPFVLWGDPSPLPAPLGRTVP